MKSLFSLKLKCKFLILKSLKLGEYEFVIVYYVKIRKYI